jgi:hypothetical protein
MSSSCQTTNMFSQVRLGITVQVKQVEEKKLARQVKQVEEKKLVRQVKQVEEKKLARQVKQVEEKKLVKRVEEKKLVRQVKRVEEKKLVQQVEEKKLAQQVKQAEEKLMREGFAKKKDGTFYKEGRVASLKVSIEEKGLDGKEHKTGYLDPSLNDMYNIESTMNVGKGLDYPVVVLKNEAKIFRKNLHPSYIKATMEILNKNCSLLNDLLALKEFDESDVESDEESNVDSDDEVLYKVHKKKGLKRKQSSYTSKQPVLRLISPFTLVKGDVQSGKSKYAHSIAMNHFVQGLTTVLVLRNLNQDSKQMMDGVQEFVNDFLKDMLDRGFTDILSLEVLSAKGKYIRQNRQAYLDAMTGKAPRLILALANSKQIGNINELVREAGNAVYVAIIDEIDALGYRKEGGKGGKGGKEEKGEVELDEKTTELMKKAVTCYGLTATMMDVVFREEKFNTDRIKVIPREENYRGINHILFKSLDLDCKAPHKKSQDQFNLDHNIKPTYAYLNQLKPFRIGYGIYEQDNFHPIVVLHKTSNIQEHHNKFFEWIQTDKTMNKWGVVTFNADGCKVYYHKMIAKTYKLVSGSSSTPDEETKSGCHYFPKSNIREIYTLLHELGATHWVTVCGHLAGRGLNFVSLDYNIRTTHQYYVPAQSTPIPERIQSLRLCGVYKSHLHCLPLECFTPEDNIANIRTGYWLEQDIIIRAKEAFKVSNMKTFVQNEKFNKCKMPEKDLCKTIKNGPLNFTKIADSKNDGGIKKVDFKKLVSGTKEEVLELIKKRLVSTKIKQFENKGKNGNKGGGGKRGEEEEDKPTKWKSIPKPTSNDKDKERMYNNIVDAINLMGWVKHECLNKTITNFKVSNNLYKSDDYVDTGLVYRNDNKNKYEYAYLGHKN